MGTMLTSKANLRGILEGSNAKNLVVSSVVHKAVIDVDETGSEASGSTGITSKLDSLKNDPQISSRVFSFLSKISSKSIYIAL